MRETTPAPADRVQSADHSTTPRLDFADWSFDPASGELRRRRDDDDATEVARLAPKPAQLLEILLTRHGEVVPREDLVAALWPGQHLDEEANLAYTLRQVRIALGDSAEEPRFIETLPRRGVRFLATVEAATDESGGDATTGAAHARAKSPGGEGPLPKPPHEDTPRTPPRRWLTAAAFALAPLLLLILARLDFSSDGAESWSTPAAVPAAGVRVALLPLRPPRPLAEDPASIAANERLGQALLVALADQPGLEVVGPATTGATTAEGGTPAELGAALEVAYTVSGGHDPTESILFLQVIRTRDGGHVFAHRFPGDEAALSTDLPAIATELAQAAQP